MTLMEIPDEEAEALKAKAAAQGLTLLQWFQKLAADPTALAQTEPTAAGRHIPHVIRERMSSVPHEIMAAMPGDGASQHDHYIYGLPSL